MASEERTNVPGVSYGGKLVQSAATLQDLILLYEKQQRPLPGCNSLLRQQADLADVQALCRLKAADLCGLCSRAQKMLTAKAYPGMKKTRAVDLTTALVRQVTTKDLTPDMMDTLHTAQVEQIMASWAFTGIDPGPKFRAKLMCILKLNGGAALRSLSCQDLVSATSALKTLGWMDEPMLDLLAAATVYRAASFDPPGLALMAQTLWACNHRTQETFSSLETAAMQFTHRFSPTDLSILVQTFVDAGTISQTMLSTAAAFVVPQIARCPMHDLAVLASSFASTGLVHKAMFESIAAKTTCLADSMELEDLAMMARSFATLKIYHREMFSAIANSSLRHLALAVQDDGPRQAAMLAGLVSSYSIVGHYHQGLFDAAADSAAHAIGSFDVQILAQLCWSFRLVKHHHAVMLTAAVGRTSKWASDPSSSMRQDDHAFWSIRSSHRSQRMGTEGLAWPADMSRGTATHTFSLGASTSLDTTALGVWSLVKVLSVCSFFGHDCRKQMQHIYPHALQAVMEQKKRQQLAGRGHATPSAGWAESPLQEVEDMCCLLDPLVQQIQQEWADEWEERFVQLTVLVLSVLVDRVKGQLGIPLSCREQVVQAYVALDDCGSGNVLRAGLAGEVFVKESLKVWKHFVTAVSPQQQKRNQTYSTFMAKLLSQLGATSIRLEPHTGDGLFSCMLLATMGGKKLAIDVTSKRDYPINSWHCPPPEALPDGDTATGDHPCCRMMKNSMASSPMLQGGQRSLSCSLIQSQGPSSGSLFLKTRSKLSAEDVRAPLIYPFLGGAVAGKTFALGGASASSILLSLSTFKVQALRHRGWVPVLLPWWEWREVAASEDRARAYLKHKIKEELQCFVET